MLLSGLQIQKNVFQDKTIHVLKKAISPLKEIYFLMFPGLSSVRKPGSSQDEGRTFEDEERCLNPYPLLSVPVGSVYGKACHVLFRLGFAFVLDHGLIEGGWLGFF